MSDQHHSAGPSKGSGAPRSRSATTRKGGTDRASSMIRIQRQAGNAAVAGRMSRTGPIPVQRSPLTDLMKELDIDAIHQQEFRDTLIQLVQTKGKALKSVGGGDGAGTGGSTTTTTPEASTPIKRERGKKKVDTSFPAGWNKTDFDKKAAIEELQADLLNPNMKFSGSTDEQWKAIKLQLAADERKTRLENLKKLKEAGWGEEKILPKKEKTPEEKEEDEIEKLEKEAEKQKELAKKRKELLKQQQIAKGTYVKSEEEELDDQIAKAKEQGKFNEAKNKRQGKYAAMLQSRAGSTNWNNVKGAGLVAGGKPSRFSLATSPLGLFGVAHRSRKGRQESRLDPKEIAAARTLLPKGDEALKKRQALLELEAYAQSLPGGREALKKLRETKDAGKSTTAGTQSTPDPETEDLKKKLEEGH